jgi:hypothetical protein
MPGSPSCDLDTGWSVKRDTSPPPALRNAISFQADYARRAGVEGVHVSLCVSKIIFGFPAGQAALVWLCAYRPDGVSATPMVTASSPSDCSLPFSPLTALTRKFAPGCCRHNHIKGPTSQNAEEPTLLTHTPARVSSWRLAAVVYKVSV